VPTRCATACLLAGNQREGSTFLRNENAAISRMAAVCGIGRFFMFHLVELIITRFPCCKAAILSTGPAVIFDPSHNIQPGSDNVEEKRWKQEDIVGPRSASVCEREYNKRVKYTRVDKNKLPPVPPSCPLLHYLIRTNAVIVYLTVGYTVTCSGPFPVALVRFSCSSTEHTSRAILAAYPRCIVVEARGWWEPKGEPGWERKKTTRMAHSSIFRGEQAKRSE
jgi:hypothetical protein